MKHLLLTSLFALIFTAQAKAQVAPSFKGECLVVPSRVLDIIPPATADSSFYNRFAIGKMQLEKDSVVNLRLACVRLGVLAARDGIKTVRNNVGLMLIVDGKIIDLGSL